MTAFNFALGTYILACLLIYHLYYGYYYVILRFQQWVIEVRGEVPPLTPIGKCNTLG